MPSIRPMRAAFGLATLFVLTMGGCAEPEPDDAAATSAASEGRADASSQPARQAGAASIPDEQLDFWNRFVERCGEAFPGRLDDATPYYRESLAGAALVAHVRECSDERIHVALHVDENRSRNWILTRAGGTVRLKHDHRHEDGAEEEITQYGGDAPTPGLSTRQIFPADEHTARILPDRADNFWFLDFVDEETLAYGVHWPTLGHSVRLVFDLTSPLAEPPPDPWGY